MWGGGGRKDRVVVGQIGTLEVWGEMACARCRVKEGWPVERDDGQWQGWAGCSSGEGVLPERGGGGHPSYLPACLPA